MNLINALHLTEHKRPLVCLVGAGGKTTTMFTLASALKSMGQQVLVTTTTKIFRPDRNQYDSLIIDAAGTPSPLEERRPGTITCLGKSLRSKDNKLIGIDKERLDQIYDLEYFNTIIVEGDGAKRKPIKAPGTAEPVIPQKTTLTLGVIGLDALGKPVTDENVHRWRQFCDVTGTKENDTIDENAIIRLITSPNGLFKNAPKSSRRVVILNKADIPHLKTIATRIRQPIESKHGIDVAITAARKNQVFL